MKSQKWLILFVLVLCFSIWGLQAKKIVIIENELHKTIHCDGDEVEVSGNKNVLNILGDCARLYVPGNKNTITVEAVAAINTLGNKNNVTWQSGINDGKPSISNLGSNNTIKHAPPAEGHSHGSDTHGSVSNKVGKALSKVDALKGTGGPVSSGKSSGEGKEIRITSHNQVKSLTLNGEKLIIDGNFNKIKVRGVCGELQVNGNTNQVHISAVGSINAFGNMNQISWKSGLSGEAPTISNPGTGNHIVQD